MTVGRLSHPLWRLLGQAPKSFCFQTNVSCWKRQMGSRCRGVVLQGKFADTSFGYFPAPNHSFPDINVCLGMWKKKKKSFSMGSLLYKWLSTGKGSYISLFSNIHAKIYTWQDPRDVCQAPQRKRGFWDWSMSRNLCGHITYCISGICVAVL